MYRSIERTIPREPYLFPSSFRLKRESTSNRERTCSQRCLGYTAEPFKSRPPREPPESPLKNGDPCRVVAGTHAGKSGTVRDVHTSKTCAVTITVVQADGVRFKSLAKNVARANEQGD
ncbi:MAG: KOW motif-containing protein [Rhodothermales bacterium]|nr:KOW motif-containing protein [Rhodothermales bacterium]